MRTSNLLRGSFPRHAAVLVLFSTIACDDPSSGGDAPRDGDLMFDLDDEEVVRFHDAYVASEDLALTRARFTAPFDCGQFDDFCAQVGPDAALEITQNQVELAREDATPEQMNEQTHAWIADAMDRYEPVDDDIAFRSSSDWAVRTKGDFRLRVRNGITTPAAGDREVWTESQFQHKDFLGIWWQVKAATLCADTGTNTQVFNNSGILQTLESLNPSEACVGNDGDFKQTTLHARLSSPGASLYTITADGCGSADDSGSHFGICAASHVEVF